jgi:pyruvate dehydrogenase E2 component (dihydrolipoamide acetyltransferase)
MPIEIIVPRLGWSMEEGAFVAWLKQDGESVRAGEPLFSIEGDKAVQEIESLDSGVLHIPGTAPKPGAPVRVGDVLGYLLRPGESTCDATLNRGSPAPIKTDQPKRTEPAERRGSDSPRTVSAQATVEHRNAKKTPAISPRALRVAIELGVDWTRVAGTGRSGRIRERDIRAAGEPNEPSHPSMGTKPEQG